LPDWSRFSTRATSPSISRAGAHDIRTTCASGIPALTLDAGQFTVVFASGKDRRDPRQPPRQLQAQRGRRVHRLATPEAHRLPLRPLFPTQYTNVSYGVAMSPTPRAHAEQRRRPRLRPRMMRSARPGRRSTSMTTRGWRARAAWLRPEEHATYDALIARTSSSRSTTSTRGVRAHAVHARRPVDVRCRHPLHQLRDGFVAYITARRSRAPARGDARVGLHRLGIARRRDEPSFTLTAPTGAARARTCSRSTA